MSMHAVDGLAHGPGSVHDERPLLVISSGAV